MNPKIAVILSTYNGEKYLRAQLNSLICQELTDFDLLVRDDGSSDHTCDIIASYASKFHIVCVQSEHHLGPAMSFINLIQKATTYDYVAFCDQDDIWKEKRLSTAISAIKAQETSFGGPIIHGSSVLKLGEKGGKKQLWDLSPPTDVAASIFQNSFIGNTITINQKAALILSLTHPDSRMIMHDWWVYLLVSLSGGKLIYESKPSVQYRIHDDNALGINKFEDNLKTACNELRSGRELIKCIDQLIDAKQIVKDNAVPQINVLISELIESKNNFIKRVFYVTKNNIKTRTITRKIMLSISFILHGHNIKTRAFQPPKKE